MRRAGKLPRVGDHVLVDFGGFEYEGEVFRVDDYRTPAWLVVEIWREGMDEPTLVHQTIDEVRPVEPAAR